MWIYMDFCTFLKGVDSWSWDRISNFERREKRKSVEDICEIHIEEVIKSENLLSHAESESVNRPVMSNSLQPHGL